MAGRDAVSPHGKDGTPALHWAMREDDLGTARLLTEGQIRHIVAVGGL